MATQGLFNLLGPTPEEVRAQYEAGLSLTPAQMGQQNLLQQITSTIAGGGAGIGYGLGRMMGGAAPGEAEAIAQQEVLRQAQQSGLSGSALFKRLAQTTADPRRALAFGQMADQAAAAEAKAKQEAEIARLDIEAKQYAADERTNAPQRRRAALEARFPTLDENQIKAVANNKELFQTYMTPTKPGETEIKKVGVAEGTKKPVYVFKQDGNVSQVVAETDAQGKQSFVPYSGAVDQTTAKQTVTVSPEGKGLTKEQEALAEVRGDIYKTAQAAAQSASQQLPVLRNMRISNAKGEFKFSGPLANVMVDTANFFNSIGFLSEEGKKELSKAESFSKNAKDLVFRELGGKLGAQVSDADRKFIEDRLPQLTTSPKARDEVLAKLEEMQTRAITYFNKMDAWVNEKGSLKGFPFVNQPSLPPLPPTTVFSSKPVSQMTDEELAAAAAKLKEGKE